LKCLLIGALARGGQIGFLLFLGTRPLELS
jgi:hypothetical protein